MLVNTIKVTVKPNSPETKITFESESEIKIDIAAQPENGKANLELVKFLSKKFGKNAKIIRGLASRKKLVTIH